MKKCTLHFQKTYKIIFKWYRWWDSNPHGFPYDFESYASANSATAAFKTNKYKYMLAIINCQE